MPKKTWSVRSLGFLLFAWKYNHWTYDCVFRRIGGKVANSSCTSILVDSDSEEEPTRKVSVSRMPRLSSYLPDDDDRAEEASMTIMILSPFCFWCCFDTVLCVQQRTTIDSADFSGINDDEMLEAVLEMSRQEAGISAPPPLEDEPTSSPDTGFGDTDANDLAYHTDMLQTDTKQPAGIYKFRIWGLIFMNCIL